MKKQKVYAVNDLLQNNPFSFLDKTISILIADDDLLLLDLYKAYLTAYPLYRISYAATSHEAQALLSSKQRFHVCIMDLGMNDVNNDEFFLIKTYAKKTSFIVVTGKDSLKKGFEAKSLGALAALKKPLNLKNNELINEINSAFITSLLLPATQSNCKPVLKDAVDTFLTLRPKSVFAWAEATGIAQQYLGRIWEDCLVYNPKYIIRLSKVYAMAFSFLAKHTKHPANDKNLAKLLAYYCNHKEIFDSIISA
jgi:DNA-binding NarL/FixJ family response regulator